LNTLYVLSYFCGDGGVRDVGTVAIAIIAAVVSSFERIRRRTKPRQFKLDQSRVLVKAKVEIAKSLRRF
jgi:hypothetical protein